MECLDSGFLFSTASLKSVFQIPPLNCLFYPLLSKDVLDKTRCPLQEAKVLSKEGSLLLQFTELTSSSDRRAYRKATDLFFFQLANLSGLSITMWSQCNYSPVMELRGLIVQSPLG